MADTSPSMEPAAMTNRVTNRVPLSDYALLLFAPVLMSTNMVIARGVAGSIPPVSMAFWRWAVALAILVPWGLRPLLACRSEILLHWRRYLTLGGLGMGLCGAPLYYGAITTSATNLGLIYAASPVMIAGLGPMMLDEHLKPRQWLGLLLAMAGVLVVIAHGEFARLLAFRFTEGDLWVLMSAISWALYSVLLRRWAAPIPALARLTAIIAGGLLVSLPGLAVEGWLVGPMPLSVHSVGTVLVLGLVPGVLAYVAWGRLVERLGAGRASIMMYIAPLYNAGLSAALLGEALEPFHLAGFLAIAAGVWFTTR